VHEYRVEERIRQAESRAKRRVESGAGPPCHAPASLANYVEVRKEVLELWDELQEASRTSLERALPRILRRTAPRIETAEVA
jgi:hypothetical protein